MMLARIILLFSVVIISFQTAYAEKLSSRCQAAVENKISESIIEQCFPAAEKGNPEAAFRIGEAYDFSKLSPVNANKALYWYNKAAQAGHPLAQRNLAALYDGGYAQIRDTFKAFYWYQQAAQQGQAHSQLMTGMMYLYGSGTPQNSIKAKYWFEQAALSGEPNGQYMYGKIIYDDQPEQAIEWFHRAASQNNGYALYQLGLMHYLGSHLLENDDTALIMANKAIQAGHDKAIILKEKLLQRSRNIVSTTDDSLLTEQDKVDVFKTKPQPSPKSADGKVQLTQNQPKAAQLITLAKPQTQPMSSVSAEPSPPTKSTPNPVDAVAKSVAQTNKLNKDDSSWFIDQPPSNYTIQLALMSQRESIDRFASYYPSVTETHFFASQFPKGKRYVLLKGSYSNWQEAKKALDQLPDKVKATKPWIRQFSKLQSQYVKPK